MHTNITATSDARISELGFGVSSPRQLDHIEIVELTGSTRAAAGTTTRTPSSCPQAPTLLLSRVP